MSDFNKTIQNIKKGNINSVYLLYGAEYYFMEQFKEHLIQATKNITEDDITIYDLHEICIQDVIADAETLPFLSDKKVIIIHNPVFLKAKQEKLSISHDIHVLEQYLQNPNPYSILLFFAPYEKLDERKKITKQFKKSSTLLNCQPMKDNQLRKWMQQIASKEKIVMEEAACLVLEAEFDSNLYVLQKEIEKLALYVGESGIVTKEIVMDVMSRSLNQNALQLVDAVLTKNLHDAIKIYKQLEKMKEDPIGLIALLAYQFRIIFQVKLMKQKGLANSQIQSAVSVHPYVVKLAVDRSSQFTVERLTNIINGLTKTDANIKSGKVDKNIAFELLLYELIKS